MAALGLLLAVFVAFFLASAPKGGSVHDVGVSLHSYQTNAPDHVVAWISVTNAGKRAVAWMNLESETKVNGQWVMYTQTIKHYPAFQPSESGKMSIRVPHDGQVWRWKAVWLTELTKFQKLHFDTREKANSILPGMKMDAYAWLGSYRHTNYSAELSSANLDLRW